MATRDETWSPALSPPTDGPPTSSLHDGGLCYIVVCRLHWHAASKTIEETPNSVNLIYLPCPKGMVAHEAATTGVAPGAPTAASGTSHLASAAGMQQIQAEAKPIIGITLRVALVHGMHGDERAGSGPAPAPVQSAASVTSATAASKALPLPTPSAPQPSSADPALLRACCHYLRGILLQGAGDGEPAAAAATATASASSSNHVLIDTLDVAMALRRGFLGAPPPGLTGSSPAATIHLPVAANRSAVNGESRVE